MFSVLKNNFLILMGGFEKYEKNDFNSIIKNYSSPNNVTKACFIVREYLKYHELDGDKITTTTDAINSKQFLDAIRVLMAYSWQNCDVNTVAQMWHCDFECERLKEKGFCLGEFQLIDDDLSTTCSKRLCKFFVSRDKM